jgi:formylglycine-generating enzyme required for sulfatase activity
MPMIVAWDKRSAGPPNAAVAPAEVVDAEVVAEPRVVAPAQFDRKPDAIGHMPASRSATVRPAASKGDPIFSRRLLATWPATGRRASRPTDAVPKRPIVHPASVPEQQTVRREPPSIITNSIGMKLVLISPGEFLMGSPDSDGMRSDDEKPQHDVRISQAFFLGMFPVTQAEYERIMGRNPSYFQRNPIVRWFVGPEPTDAA